MKKHAFLVIAHSNFKVLEVQISLLDDCRNDIFIHFDAKVGIIDLERFQRRVKYSKVFFIDRVSVHWAGFSQVETTLKLMEAARAQGQYHYYHLLSGQDLPIKSNDSIHTILDGQSSEFIGVVPEVYWYSQRRVKFYHLFIESRFFRKSKILKGLSFACVELQRFLGVNRYGQADQIYNGWSWFSVTDRLVAYLLSNKASIERRFRHTLASDELFIHTIVMNSEFKERVSGFSNLRTDSLRYIDWKRGKPYTFSKGDFGELVRDNGCLFARKFDENFDMEIIEMLARHLNHSELPKVKT